MADLMKLGLPWLCIFLLLAEMTACAARKTEPSSTVSSELRLTSAAFKDGGLLPRQYSYKLGKQCSGENLSPPLSWSGAPAGTQSFALTVVDPDARDWVHWVVFNIPPDTTELPEHPAGPPVGVAGTNGFGELGWGGPCPPSGTHHYVFTLYALDQSLGLKQGASYKDLQGAMRGHILAQATLTGLFSK